MRGTEQHDAIILGGGIFGLYAARTLVKKGRSVLVIEREAEVFTRASFVNQARVHLGYHYPRSIGTALNSAECFERFVRDFGSAINEQFKKIYAVASRNSFTTAKQFEHFCEILGIPAEPIKESKYFLPGTVEGCYLTKEYTFGAKEIAGILKKELENSSHFRISYRDRVISAEKHEGLFEVKSERGLRVRAPLVVNATYSGINSVLETFGLDPLPLKYEIYEVVLGRVSAPYVDAGITVMDGPFFSVMPFGLSGSHSMTAVEYSPHQTNRSVLPTFSCQTASNGCKPQNISNCDSCSDRPQTAFPFMYQLAKKFLKEDFSMQYERSHFASKTVFEASELDDSRPTCVRVLNEHPRLITVLSGKVGTIFEMEGLLV